VQKLTTRDLHSHGDDSITAVFHSNGDSLGIITAEAMGIRTSVDESHVHYIYIVIQNGRPVIATGMGWGSWGRF